MRNSFVTASAVLALNSLLLVQNAQAQMETELSQPVSSVADDYVFPECVDGSGDRVEYSSAADYKKGTIIVMYMNVRYRDIENQSGPVIIYNQSFFDGLSRVQRDFSFAHECVHLSSGHAVEAYQNKLADRHFGRSDMLEMEDEADCDAAKRMRDEFGYGAEQMGEVYGVITHVTPQKSIQARWDKIVQCYGEDIPVLDVTTN